MSRDPYTTNPLALLRLGVRGLLGLVTFGAVALWLSGIEPRAVVLALACWTIYGAATAVLDGVLDPAIDSLAAALQGVGLRRAGGGYSGIEALEARGAYAAAAAAYLERDRAGTGDVEALVRRARLLAGPLASPEAARLELEGLREGRRLRPPDDIRVGLALAELAERQGDRGRAMAELRRLIELHPTHRHAARARARLAALKEATFGP